MENQKAWIIGIIMALVGVLISSSFFVFVVYSTGTIYGVVALICGIIAGGALGLGYKIGNGKIKTKSDSYILMWSCAFFGLLAMVFAYIGPYFIFATKSGISLGNYFELIQFDGFDILFIVLGAYAGKWAGSFFMRSIAVSTAYSEAIGHIKKKAVKKMDSKFK